MIITFRKERLSSFVLPAGQSFYQINSSGSDGIDWTSLIYYDCLNPVQIVIKLKTTKGWSHRLPVWLEQRLATWWTDNTMLYVLICLCIVHFVALIVVNLMTVVNEQNSERKGWTQASSCKQGNSCELNYQINFPLFSITSIELCTSDHTINWCCYILRNEGRETVTIKGGKMKKKV